MSLQAAWRGQLARRAHGAASATSAMEEPQNALGAEGAPDGADGDLTIEAAPAVSLHI